jgi:hypothetical protein
MQPNQSFSKAVDLLEQSLYTPMLGNPTLDLLGHVHRYVDSLGFAANLASQKKAGML